ncbi:C-terminal binding protein [Verminephrobacter aporrectodeae subsp. tuberculatae]|nr:C-terminal binding protein [Verminephrobacter aporrectodeae subsp. tuberculatae]MCW8201444.1 C-terminal binding protein [Verminephrobacter aporrectodeae subsp. tuberculatae]
MRCLHPGSLVSISCRQRRVVVTDYNFPDVAVERAAAEQHGAQFIAFQCKSAEDVTQAVKDADVAVVQFAPLTAPAIAGMAQGATVIRYGIGYDNIDLHAAFDCGLAVGYIPDYCTAEVADHTVSMVLAALRKLPQLDASVRAGDWKAVAVAKPIKPFDQTTVGFLGLGRIGSLVLTRLQPFGFRFLVADPQIDKARAAQLGATSVERDALFRHADVISLHAPATAETTHVVNAQTLRTMKPDAIIVNTARGRLVDEAALAQALAAGNISGAALDVFETEALPADSPLRGAPNLILTPHAAWYSEHAIMRLQELAAADIARILTGQGPRCPVPGSPGP